MGTSELLIERIRAGRTVALMGVLNVTPDSFSDGGLYLDPTAAFRRVDELLDEGADIIDIGGESTRPGSLPVSPAEQIARIREPLTYATRAGRVIVSVDTASPEVARFALGEGAAIVNDVSCLADPDLARAVAEHDATLIVMHARGHNGQMLDYSVAPDRAYGDIVADVRREWCDARARAVTAGMSPRRIWIDPGLGYQKNARHSLDLLRRLAELVDLGPVVVGPSRKSFLTKLAGPAEPTDRLGGGIAACLAALDRGASVLRVHDVHAVRQAIAVHRAIEAVEKDVSSQDAGITASGIPLEGGSRA